MTYLSCLNLNTLVRLILLFLFISSFCNVWAQHPSSIQLTEEYGLPDIEFYDIIEDSNQFIWLAADNGLYRYNGNSYTYFSHPQQRGNAVFGLLEDNKGHVWCNNISGQFFYTDGDELKLFLDFGKELNGELVGFKVTSTDLLIFSISHLYQISLKSREVTILSQENTTFFGLPLQFESNYFYTKNDQIIKTNALLQAIDSLEIGVIKNDIAELNISKRINVVSNGAIFLCYFIRFNENVFYHFNIDKKEYYPITIPKTLKNRIIHHIFFKEESIWIATNSGIQVYRLNGNKLKYQHTLFEGNSVTKTIKDSKQNYWIITKGNGIFVIPNINIFRYNLPNNFTNVSRIKNIEKDQVIIGTKNGASFLLNTKSFQLTLLDSSSLFGVTNILYKPKQRELLITKETQAFNYSLSKRKMSKLNKLDLFNAKKITVVDSATYIISTYKNAIILDENYTETFCLVDKRSYTNFYAQRTKNIYVSTVEGLYVFDEYFQKSEICYKNKTILAVSISETEDQSIWLSTFNHGIFRIKNNHVVAHYSTENGLLSNKVEQIEADGNYLWVATNKGIQLLNSADESFKNLTKQSGIPSYRIEDIEVIDNQVLFASNIGVFGFEKDKVFKTYNKKDIYFTRILINDKSQPIKESYQLNHDQNKVEFNFNVNGFQSHINTRYQYRLLGIDTIWKTTNELVNSVNYNSLASGNYTFQVKTQSENDEIKSIQFSIIKPFWERWWFYALAVITSGLVIFLIFVTQIRKLKKQQEEALQKELLNKQLVFSQLENLRSQMNPHFIFNALNSIQEYIILNEKELASSYLIKFSRLIRIYLNHSRENEVWLTEEIKALQIYLELEKNRFEDILDYTISVTDAIAINTIKIPSLFIQPYVENALKHGLLHKKKDRILKVIIDVDETKDNLICTIEDNGIGMKASKQLNQQRQPLHKSFATNANMKRVELLNSGRERKIKVEITDLTTDTETGTRVHLIIPIETQKI